MRRNANPIQFAEWAPDKSTLSGYGRDAKGCISQSGRYAPLNDLTAYKAGASISGTCIGARGFWSSAGNVHIFIGDEFDLYKMASRQPAIVSKAGGYTPSIPDGWQFEQFGDHVVAVNAAVTTPQVYQMGTSSLFADLAGSPPVSTAVFRVGNQLCLANGRTLSVSGFNNIELWDYATATQGVQVDVDQRGGNIQTGVGGEVGLIFQERGIVRMTYVGPPTVFSLETIEWKHGAISREAVSQYGRNTFFVSETGMFVTDGMSVQPIGDGKVDKYFSDNLNYSARNKVTTAIDFARKLWIVAFPTAGNVTADHLLIYSMADNRWTHDEITTQMLFDMPREGITIDDTAAIIALEGTDVSDDIPTSVDDPQWRETRVQVAAVDGDGGVSTFEGATRAATMSTTEFEPVKLKQTLVDELWPEIDIISTNVTAFVNVRRRNLNNLNWNGQPLTWGGSSMFWNTGAQGTTTTTSEMNEHGFIPVRLSARYMEMGITVAAGTSWTEATGIQWRGSAGGER